MDGYLFCGLSEQLETLEVRQSNLTRWWVAPDGWPDRAPRDVVRRCVVDAIAMWAEHAPLQGVEASSEAEADLVVRPAAIDGGMGVLADCMLPGPRVQVLRCDNAEMWTVQLGPSVSSSLIDLDRVLRHEIGHFWGIGHDRKGAQSLMAPTYSRSIWSAQEWDVSQIQSLYGKRETPPPSPASPPTTDDDPYYTVLFNRAGSEICRFKRMPS